MTNTHESIETVSQLAAGITEHGEPYGLWADYQGVEYADPDRFEDAYLGEHDSLEDYAHGYIEDTGLLDEMPENLRYYFDYEKFARDLRLGGDVYTLESGHHTVYVFDGHA